MPQYKPKQMKVTKLKVPAELRKKPTPITTNVEHHFQNIVALKVTRSTVPR
jgi:hypothetical protein